MMVSEDVGAELLRLNGGRVVGLGELARAAIIEAVANMWSS